MYTVYIIFATIIVLSFITGNIVTIVEHKSKRKNTLFEKGIIVDKEIL